MKISRRFLIVLAVLLVAVVAVFVSKQHSRPLPGGHSHSQKAVYYCPMHPAVVSDRPGNCSICSMRLVKKEEQKSEEVCILHNCSKAHDGAPCPMMVVAKPGEKVTCPICGAHIAGTSSSSTKKILYWTDPMMPGYKSDKPGKSPMDMDLIPVYEEAGGVEGAGTAAPGGYTAILLSPQKQQLIGVKSAPAQKRRIVKTIRTVGKVMPDETRIIHVHPKVEGWVDQIYARYEGDKVKKGQPLFSFYSPDFVSTQQEYLTAMKAVKEISAGVSADVRSAAEANLEAARQRLRWWDISEEQIRELEMKGVPSKTLLLTSPIDGVVLKKHVLSGEYMERGGDYYHLADLSAVWVEADLYEYDLPLVAVGQEAVVILPNDPVRRFSGKLVYLSPVLKSETRTATARLELANPEGVLRPDMFTNVEIGVDLGEQLVVPEEAVFDTGKRKILFVVKGEGVFEPREVTVGAKADGVVVVKSGVSEGESVVTSGNFLIDSESRLKSALTSMESGGHQHGQ